MNPSDISTKAKSTIEKYYPKQEWVGLYTDGSATDAIKNGGGGVFTEWLDGSTTSDVFPTGATCSNYRAEVEALIVALNVIKSTPNSKTMKCFSSFGRQISTPGFKQPRAPELSQGQPASRRGGKRFS